MSDTEVLEQLKRVRVAEVQSVQASRRARIARRLKAIMRSNLGFAHLLNFVFKKTKMQVTEKILRRFAKPPAFIAEPDSRKVHVAVRITGGIGDVVVVARWLKQFIARFGPILTVDVFFISDKSVRQILAGVGAREILPASQFDAFAPYYDVALTASQFLNFHWSAFRYDKIVHLAPGLISFVGEVEKAQKPYRKFLDYHPSLDGAFADAVVLKRLNRSNFLSHVSGFEDPDPLLDIEGGSLDSLPELKGPGPYVTLHDGWDTNFQIASERPTKAYPVGHFEKAVALIKASRPDLAIVQVGTKSGSHIKGVDIDLRGRTSMAQVVTILKDSKGHIDSESGLVHLATALGTRCVVIFGPTNPRYYGYGQNINLAPRQCGNCMWVTDSWMDVCAAGYDTPICMPSVSPELVSDALQQIVDPSSPISLVTSSPHLSARHAGQ